MTAPLRVMIADDERPARSFLASLLRGFVDVRIVGEADSGRQAVSISRRLQTELQLSLARRERRISEGIEVKDVRRNFASWNLISDWLARLDALRRAA